MSAETVIAEETGGPQETGGRSENRATPRDEAAEIRAWRAEKVRRWPRRAWIFALRIVAVCICAVVALVVLEQAISFTTTSVHGVSRDSAPHQK
ncbi:MAG TPA: hypothetical protein VMH36_06715 [Alphaproteobacteria bacterium]|nr:hypothetical protein [Alphaproteobacteria bacterium]